MKTPIVDFVKSYAQKDMTRLHMPGHKGQSFLGIEKLDITEIDGADVLYSPEGIIKESEDNATSLFDSGHTYFSTEGSSLCIRAMIFLASMGKEKPVILAARNVHKAFVYAAALCDAEIEWIYPEKSTHLCSCNITKNDVSSALKNARKKPCAVYVTSPDYLGNILDIKGISEVCKSFDIPLLVDNAHGAYLNFLGENRHPIHLGASMCCDSAHKTLPVLTGGAYLHISKDAGQKFFESARSALSLFASTSPSYLILQSLDLCNRYLDGSFRTELEKAIKKVDSLKNFISASGFSVADAESLKLTINSAKSGYSGYELSDILRKDKIECEFCDSRFVVMMFTPQNSDHDFERIKKVFASLPVKEPLHETAFLKDEKPVRAMSVRKAIFSPRETLQTEKAVGRICASPTVSCPPAVPIAVSGEIITEKMAEIFKRYNISEVEVVR